MSEIIVGTALKRVEHNETPVCDRLAKELETVDSVLNIFPIKLN
jgi:hypothetical protein